MSTFGLCSEILTEVEFSVFLPRKSQIKGRRRSMDLGKNKKKVKRALSVFRPFDVQTCYFILLHYPQEDNKEHGS